MAPRPLALFVHHPVKLVEVELDAALGEDLLGELAGETVGVVELEGGGSGEHCSRLHGRQLFVEELVARLESPSEPDFFALCHLGDGVPTADELRVRLAHHVDRGADETGQHQITGAQQ